MSIEIYYYGESLLKNVKALSPVIAAIILVATAVAVSLSVAFWTGRLTLGFMHTEELKVTEHSWSSDFTYIELKLVNTGTDAVKINQVMVNSQSVNVTYVSGTNPLEPGNTAVLRISYEFVQGETYKFYFITSNGNKFFYMATAKS